MVAESDLPQQPTAFPNSVETPRTPDITAARLRRSITQSRTARSNITNLVDAIKVAKPPKPPSKHNNQHTNVIRRRALIPLSEGRNQLEARIRSLEDTVTARDDALIHLKRQLGRTLIKRRHADKEKDTISTQLSQTLSIARTQQLAAISARADLQSTVDDISISVKSANDVLSSSPIVRSSSLSQNSATTSKNITDLQITLNNISDAIDIAKAKLAVDLPSCSNLSESLLASNANKNYLPSVSPSDEDVRSCASFASSILGDDRESQLESLVEFVDILEAKLSSGPPNQAASNALNRARNTISAQKNQNPPHNELQLETDNVRKRETIAHIVNQVLKEQLHESNSNGVEDADVNGNSKENVSENEAINTANLAQSVMTRLELEEARKVAECLQKRVSSLEKVAERAIRVDDLVEQNATLRRDLTNAKETITRLIRDRGPTRRSNCGSPYLTPKSTPRVPKALRNGNGVIPEQDEDIMRRVLDWQQDASVSTTARSTKRDNDDESTEDDTNTNGWNSRLPDRVDGGATRSTCLPERIARRRRASSAIDVGDSSHVISHNLPNMSMGLLTNMADDGGSVAGGVEGSEGSADVVGNDDATSTQSLPIGGILRRPNTLAMTGILSYRDGRHALASTRNIYRTCPAPVDGLRDLLQN